MATALISVYSIFIVFFITSAIKNLFVNANGYSRFLRIMIVFVVFGYLAYVGFLSARPIMYISGHMTWAIQDTLSIITFFLITVVSLGTLIVIDYKRNSVRDAWKYSARVFKTFKTTKPRDYWKITFKVIVALAVLTSMSIAIVVIKFTSHWYVITAMSLLIMHVVMNYLISGIFRNNLLNKNVRYNLLKENVSKMNSTKHSKTDKEVGKKILELYQEVFLKSWFYERRRDTNNAIIYDIYLRTGCDEKALIKYFRDPVTKRPISLVEYESLMKITK